jgi:hypothetical protein
MKTRGLFIAIAIVLSALTAPIASAQGPQATATGKRVTIATIPTAWVLVRDVNGGYDLHAKVFASLIEYVGTTFRVAGNCFGIYPVDPDAARKGEIHWQAGVAVVPGAPLDYAERSEQRMVEHSSRELERERAQLPSPSAPYRIVKLERTLAAIIDSSVADAPKDGLSMFAWMAENGYAQSGPTRMEYLSNKGPSQEIPTRIIVPVVKRASGLSVPPA